jgi:hypothetical protein
MAEGIKVNKENCLKDAIKVAARLADRGDVLVYDVALDALAAERDALRAALEAVVDTTDGKPGALVQECRQIARTALRAIAEGEA